MKKRNTFKIYIIGCVLLLLITVLSISGATSGMTGSSNTKAISEYKSPTELFKNTGFSLVVPNIVVNYDGDFEVISSTMGSVIEVSCGEFSFKASPLVSYNVSILGLYDECSVDNKYIVNSSEDGIKFLRYRLEYPGLEHCTVIDYCTETTTHGLLVERIMTDDEVLSLLNISPGELKETSTEEILALENNDYITDKDITYNENDFERYDIGGSFTVELPKFNSSINKVEENGITKFYIDKKLVFVFIYNDYDIETNAFEGQSEEFIADDIVLKYRTNNPFEIGHTDHANYNKFLSTIEHIKETIMYN